MISTETAHRLPLQWQLLPPRRGDAPRGRPLAPDAEFLAGQDAGARTSACVARLAALELMDGAHWWDRWRRRLMARALVACAEELEGAAWTHARTGGTA